MHQKALYPRSWTEGLEVLVLFAALAGTADAFRRRKSSFVLLERRATLTLTHEHHETLGRVAKDSK